MEGNSREIKGLVPFTQHSDISLFSSLKPFKPTWTIKAKILHSWRQYSETHGQSLELILADETGTRIAAVVRKALVNRFANILKVGQWKIIKTFQLNKEYGQYRASHLSYKICFIHATTVLVCDYESDESFVRLARLDEILCGELKKEFLIDVVGMIYKIGEMVDVAVNGKPTPKLEFVLKDNEENQIDCTLWGKYAEIVNGACQKSNNQSVFCLIQFAKIHEYQDKRSICNAFNASIVSTDEFIPEIKQFKTLFPTDALFPTPMFSTGKTREITYSSEDYYLQFPTKTVAELLETDEVGKCRVLCTIIGIDTDFGWFYFGCNKCHKKVYRETPNDTNSDLTSKTPKFFCENCKGICKSVTPRFKLHIQIKDDTGESKCMMFDKFGAEVVGQTANSLLCGSMDEIEDPESLPEPVTNIIGKSLIFLLSVEPKNIAKHDDTYKVAKVFTGETMIEENKREVEALPSCLIEQTVLQLTNSDGTSEVTVETSNTPSSKRKDNDVGYIEDQFSVNRKRCAQNDGVQHRDVAVEGVKLEINADVASGNVIPEIVKRGRKGVMESKKLKFDPTKVKQEKDDKVKKEN